MTYQQVDAITVIVGTVEEIVPGGLVMAFPFDPVTQQYVEVPVTLTLGQYGGVSIRAQNTTIYPMMYYIEARLTAPNGQDVTLMHAPWASFGYGGNDSSGLFTGSYVSAGVEAGDNLAWWELAFVPQFAGQYSMVVSLYAMPAS